MERTDITMKWIKIDKHGLLPRDGTCVLVGNCKYKYVGEARFKVLIGHEESFIFVGTDDDTMVAYPSPTHWMPLPEAPED